MGFSVDTSFSMAGGFSVYAAFSLNAGFLSETDFLVTSFFSTSLSAAFAALFFARMAILPATADLNAALSSKGGLGFRSSGVGPVVESVGGFGASSLRVVFLSVGFLGADSVSMRVGFRRRISGMLGGGRLGSRILSCNGR